MGEASIPTVIARLSQCDFNDPDLQHEAAASICDLANEGNIEAITQALLEALKASQALVRAHAAESLGVLGQRHRKAIAPLAVAPLVVALNDRYRLTRSYAARALGQLGDEHAVPSLLQALENDPFFGVRAEAAEALRKLCPDETSPIFKLAREKLKVYRARELQRNEERSRRVLAEMDLSLEKLGEIMHEIEEALRQGKNDYAMTLTREVNTRLNAAQGIRNEMGSLLASRERLYAL